MNTYRLGSFLLSFPLDQWPLSWMLTYCVANNVSWNFFRKVYKTQGCFVSIDFTLLHILSVVLLPSGLCSLIIFCFVYQLSIYDGTVWERIHSHVFLSFLINIGHKYINFYIVSSLLYSKILDYINNLLSSDLLQEKDNALPYGDF